MLAINVHAWMSMEVLHQHFQPYGTKQLADADQIRLPTRIGRLPCSCTSHTRYTVIRQVAVCMPSTFRQCELGTFCYSAFIVAKMSLAFDEFGRPFIILRVCPSYTL